ncbi:MAG TPA: WGxxGxxG family protein [Allosphingosinicella sp.]|jgi:hypothetical protein
MLSSSRRAFAAAAWAVALTVAAGPASAQQVGRRDPGVATETQERQSEGQDNSFDWNWIGLVGLLGLAGLRRRPDYHHAI